MRRFSALANSLIAIGLVGGALTAAGQVIIRGNNGKVIITGAFSNGQEKKAEPDPAGPHLIEFFDGRQLHGTLEAVDLKRGEITWRRADASAPLTIPTMLINRLTFVPTAGLQNEFGMEIPPLPPANAAPPAPNDNTTYATVKFGGGDWLRAEVTNILDNKVHLKLADGSPLAVDRAQVEWIYFSKIASPECYDGPTSLAGWSGSGWSYHEGALHATSPQQITRTFAALPDQVEYEFTADQGNLMSQFNFSLHGRSGQAWGGEPGIIQCMLRASTLTVFSNADGHYKNESVDLTKKFGDALDGRAIAGRSNPVHFQLYEDFTGGRIAIFVNGHKAGEWGVQKGEPGRNRGTFAFQPTIWSPTSEQTLSKIRVVPWDGRIPEEGEKAEDHSSDHLSLADGTAKDGRFIDLAAGTVRLRVDGSDFEAPNAQVKMLRFAHRDNAATPSEAPIAHVLLTEGGEFDATRITWRESRMQIATRFGSELPVSTASVAEVNFLQSAPPLTAAEDVLVFENGDRLKGKLEMAEENQKVRWRTDETAQPVEFEPVHVSGVRSGWSEAPRKGKIDSVVRFRNGDWLAGRFLTLDKDQLVLDTPDAGQLTISRALARTLYFSPDGQLPISDGAADDREWLKGLSLGDNQAFPTRRRSAPTSSVKWKSFDGAFSLLSVENPESVVSRPGGVQIGRLLDSLPSLVEMSFDVTGLANQIIFTAQLFTDPSNAGYFMQLHSQGIYIYDLNPGDRARGMVPQQIPFEGKLKPDANRRHVQLLANRDAGQLTVLVDGVVITHFGTKPGKPPRQLGRGLMLSPQINIPCTFSNIWIGPWNGRVPGKTPASDDNQDTAILSNGDEAPGTVEIATPSSVKLASEVGPLELPLERVTMIDFGGAPAERTVGARLHLAGAGALTVDSYHVENDTITCRSEMVGDLRLPLHAVQELVFSASKPLPDKE
ncbi:hypothetical protein CfE428DRAFT_2748 [Chthoniobacter flavus Ellin428]|uniref:Uncharacterized protein n=1 Tax=Chthoniobacter flavus Ellin428 TaxID=497964 RepID=B4D1G0_9BACT|nr:hypothetical protein [Chthoniobacter flavus]EDY19572.1 hypothetical protein CfE428DRAFT_2748 [Chthoniobacter flavus Ellin428]